MKPLMVLFGSATLVFSLAESFVGGGASAMVVAALLSGLLVLMEGVNSV